MDAGGYLALKPRSEPRLRLFCFHHAGGGALSFARWQRRLSPDVCVVPVRLPGRESRLREPRITRADQLLAELDRHLSPLLDLPYAFYGHSLGGLVAYAFAAHREQRGGRPPELLVAGACSPPHLRTPALEGDDELSDAELVSVLSGADGMSAYLLDRPERLRLMVATMRDDLRLARSLRDGAERPLGGPVFGLAGRRDVLVRPDAVRAWSNWTTGVFRMLTVDGDHFFVRDPVAPRTVAAALDGLVSEPAAVGSAG